MNKKIISILIVEDDPLVAKDIQNKLKHQGYTHTAVVDNALDAINHMARIPSDLILMDIVLAGDMDGIQAATLIKEKHNIPIIYLTAYSGQDLLERAKITDPMAYIIKPVAERELSIVISIALNKAESERLRDENCLINATLVSFSDALIVWDPKGIVIRVNDAALNLLAAKEQEIVGATITDVLNLQKLDDPLFGTAALVYTIEDQGGFEDEHNFILKRENESPLLVRISANRIFDHQACYGYVMLIRDDTQRQTHELDLLESETRFRQLVNHIDSIFILFDMKKNQVIHVSPAYEKIFGHSLNLASLEESSLLTHIHPDDKPKITRLIKSLYKKEACAESFKFYKPDGQVHWAQARCYPVMATKNELIDRMACIINDVTEDKKLELKLKQAAKVYETTSEGIMIMDAEFKVVAVNPAFSKTTGFSEVDIIGQPPKSLLSGLHDRTFYQNAWAIIEENGYWQGEVTSRRKNGDTYPLWVCINMICDDDKNIINFVTMISDISSIKKSQSRLDFLAHHDHLTGFANRLLFNARLKHAIDQARRSNQKVSVMLMDLDRFKDINDSLGHSAGDELLKLLAVRLRLCLREEDTLARLGGDEFIFLVEDLENLDEIELIAQKIQDIFIEPFLLGTSEVIVTASMGISLYPDNGDSVAELVKTADIAMYKAKQRGKNCFAFYNEDFNKYHDSRLVMATQMRLALTNDEFIVHYQPQVCLKTGNITGVEALIRWQHPEKGLIPPMQFIPLAEETGFIEKLGEWVLYESCRQCKAWQQQGYDYLTLAVNLSARQFMFSNITATIKSVLKKTGLDASFLELEITESGLMDQADKVMDTLNGLKSIGVKLSIDDFGTGYSSLSYLKRFPIDKLKIDRSFVMDLPQDEQDAAIAKSIIVLGKSLKLTVIAEGVETEAQREFLMSEGCDEMQGYLFSKPVAADDLEELLKKIKPTAS